MEASQRAAPKADDAAARDGGTRLGDKVSAINVTSTIRPNEGVLGISSSNKILTRTSRRHKTREIKCAQLHVSDRDVQRAKLSGENFSEGRQCRAYCCFRCVERRVDGRNDGRRKHEDLWRHPFLADRVQAGCEER